MLSNGVSVTEEPALTIIGKYKTILNLLSICGIKYGVDKDKGTLCLTELGKRMERRMTILKGL